MTLGSALPIRPDRKPAALQTGAQPAVIEITPEFAAISRRKRLPDSVNPGLIEGLEGCCQKKPGVSRLGAKLAA